MKKLDSIIASVLLFGLIGISGCVSNNVSEPEKSGIKRIVYNDDGTTQTFNSYLIQIAGQVYPDLREKEYDKYKTD
jgi:hypothetical protein